MSDTFERLYDRAIAIAVLKAYIWERDYVHLEYLEFVRHYGEFITVIGETDDGWPIEESFKKSYMELGDKQITALEEPKFQASKELENATKKMDQKMEIKTKYFDCACSAPNHTLRFVYDIIEFNDGNELPTIYTEVMMSHYLPWYKRITVAVKYIFGYDTVDHYSGWELDIDDVVSIQNMLTKLVDANTKYLEQNTKHLNKTPKQNIIGEL